jgi:hypothetical protein
LIAPEQERTGNKHIRGKEGKRNLREGREEGLERRKGSSRKKDWRKSEQG